MVHLAFLLFVGYRRRRRRRVSAAGLAGTGVAFGGGGHLEELDSTDHDQPHRIDNLVDVPEGDGQSENWFEASAKVRESKDESSIDRNLHDAAHDFAAIDGSQSRKNRQDSRNGGVGPAADAGCVISRSGR